MNCENCNTLHDGTYGAGRFCSIKCARGFSTKKKRKEINEKVKNKLTKDPYIKICKGCESTFKTKKPHIQYCSMSCASTHSGTNGMTWTVKDSSKMGGLRNGGGRTKVFEYINAYNDKMYLNVDEIQIAKILDESGYEWVRNSVGFHYETLDGNSRKYYPDFYVPSLNLYVEYKGWVTSEMEHKMKDAVSKSGIKLLVIYSNDKRYNSRGVNMEQFYNHCQNILEMF